MSHDRQLVDAIKAHFARKSSVQLETIARGDADVRWSSEAVIAANEVLRNRLAGVAQEPQAPEEDELPEFHYEPEEVAMGVLVGLFTGYMVIPYYQRCELPDLPVPFGRNMAWLAVETGDTVAVATALGLREATPASWGQGVEAAHQGSVFVTPPLGDWTLVVGTPLFPTPDGTAPALKLLLEQLGQQFAESQYFCNHRDIGLYVWARARQGQVDRAYGWLGAQGCTLWEEGALTKEELALGFRLGAGQPPQVDCGDDNAPVPFSEDSLFQLACYWSIDPTTLDEEFQEPVSGLLGKISR